MFRIKDLSIRLAGNGEDDEDRLPPPDPDSAACGLSAAPCSCGEHDTAMTCAGGGEEESGEEQEAQGLLRQQLRRELGEARP